MSLHVIKEQIMDFLNSPDAEVIAIKGGWGVGKTYTWNTQLEAAQKAGEIALHHYAYVSLFGVRTLQDLRTEITFNKLNTSDLKHSQPITKIQKGSGKYLPKILNQALKSAGINTGTLIETMFSSLSNSMIKNTIICIDDFERLSLTETEVLGFINDLRQIRGCKVALLLNDDHVKEYNTYREKVIDKEVVFNITPSEVADIVFKDDPFYNTARQAIETLNLQNLRIAIKAKNLFEDAYSKIPRFRSLRPDTKQRFLTSIILYSLVFFDNKCGIDFSDLQKEIDVDKLETSIYMKSKHSGKSKESLEKQELLSTILRMLGYDVLSTVDIEAGNSVKNGFFNVRLMEQELTTANKLHELKENRGEYEHAISQFFSKLNLDPEKQVSKCVKLFEDNIESMDLLSLTRAYTTLGKFGATQDQLQKLIDVYSSFNAGSPEVFNVFGNVMIDLNIPEELRAQLDEKFDEFSSPGSPKNLLERLILGEIMYHDSHRRDLLKLRHDDIKDVIKRLPSEKFIAAMLNLTSLPSVSNGLIELQKIIDSAKEEISEESDHNKFLMARFKKR